MLRTIKTFLFITTAALLLIISFPQLEWWPLAWVALVPFLLMIDGDSPARAFRRAYLCGFLFFAGTVGWFIYVTYPGAVVLIAYLSLYFAIFGIAVVYFKPLPVFPRIYILSAVWVALEFIRSHLFTGFGWVTLGHSQGKNLLMIQIADVVGVYGVSFLVILVNLLICETIRIVMARKHDQISSLRKVQWSVITVLIIVICYGVYSFSHSYSSRFVRVGIVQPNIPQSIKWEEALQPSIVEKTIHLTKGLSKEHLDLIVWPETSLPGIVHEVPKLVTSIKQAALQTQTPILMGAVTQEKNRYFNSALLVNAQGQIVGRYDKIHLVPFGEYLPLRPLLGWINKFVPLDDFTSGREYTVFPVENHPKAFGVLICFEDTLAYLRRNFTKAGAQFFVNMTNDAWFEDTKAPFLHLQAAAIGCIENRRALVRAANTGISAVIDPFGRVIAAVRNDEGKMSFVTGVTSVMVPLSTRLTFYTKYGDLFTYLCFFGILNGVFSVRRYRRNGHA